MTFYVAGGYNNPVVALILAVQSRKYYQYSPEVVPYWSGYEWASIFGPVLGGILAGLFCIYLKRVYAKVALDSRQAMHGIENTHNHTIEDLLANSMYHAGKYEPLTDNDEMEF